MASMMRSNIVPRGHGASGESRDPQGFHMVALPARADGIAWALRRAYVADRSHLPDDLQDLLDQLQ